MQPVWTAQVYPLEPVAGRLDQGAQSQSLVGRCQPHGIAVPVGVEDVAGRVDACAVHYDLLNSLTPTLNKYP